MGSSAEEMWSAVGPPARPTYPSAARLPSLVEDDEDDEPPSVGGYGHATVRRVTWDDDARVDVAPGPRRFEIEGAGATDAGMVRSANEDALLVMREQAIFAVADGMGGHAGGAVASQLAIDALAASVDPTPRDLPVTFSTPRLPDEAAALVRALAAAGAALGAAAAEDDRLAEMGTTLVVARFCPDKGRLFVGHVGDSRCYRLRDAKLEQLTRDHTLAELGVRGRQAHHLSRSVGPRGSVEADVLVLEPRPGDVYLLCTDGLTKMVESTTMQDILSWEDAPSRAAAELVAVANAQGGRDNVTAIVVRVTRASEGGEGRGR